MKKENKDPDFIQVLARNISVKVFLKVFRSSGLTANQITVLNFFTNNLLAVYFFSRGNYISNLIALFFCFFSAAIDYIDGTVARLRNESSGLGEWLDSFLDSVWQILLVGGIAYGVFISRGRDYFWLKTGFMAVVSLVALNYIGYEYRNRFGLNLYRDAGELRKLCGKCNTALGVLYLEIIAPDKFIFIFLFTLRYLISIGALFNALHIVLIMILCFATIKTLVLFYIFVLYYRHEEGKRVRDSALIDSLRKFKEKSDAD